MKASEWLTALTNTINEKGMPKTVGAKGWITENNNYYYNDDFIATSTDGLKGWIYVDCMMEDEFGPYVTDVDSLVKIINAVIEDNNDGETSIYVDAPDDKVRYLELINDESDGKSWEYESDMDEDELFDYIRNVLAENGEEIDEDEEPDMGDFLWSYCDNRDGDVSYSFGYGVAYVEWADGFTIGFTNTTNGIALYKYGDESIEDDVSPPPKVVTVNEMLQESGTKIEPGARWPFPTERP